MRCGCGGCAAREWTLPGTRRDACLPHRVHSRRWRAIAQVACAWPASRAAAHLATPRHSHVMYSDDGGDSWTLGGTLNDVLLLSNECQVTIPRAASCRRALIARCACAQVVALAGPPPHNESEAVLMISARSLTERRLVAFRSGAARAGEGRATQLRALQHGWRCFVWRDDARAQHL